LLLPLLLVENPMLEKGNTTLIVLWDVTRSIR
jgi:hypothetical protein